MSDKSKHPNLDSIRAQLNTNHGQAYWRSLEELAETDAFQELLHREFPRYASEWRSPLGRRRFLQLMSASLALAGLGACTRQPTETIVPYVRAPEEIVPGKPLFFATAMPLSGVASALLVESHEGRPTKVEGNPEHPASLGATDLFAQASLLTLYDPDRSQTLTYLGEIRPWAEFLGAVRAALEEQRPRRGAGLRILTETITSPTLASQIQALLREFPAAKWHQYEPSGNDNARAGARRAFGQYVNPVYRFENANVILSVDSDFLACGPGSLRYAREFSKKRRASEGTMNRLYVVESTVSNTGAVADHRLPLRPSQIEPFVRAVAKSLGVGDFGSDTDAVNAHARWIAALARDLRRHRGASLVVPGDPSSPTVHALAHAINHALGNVGKTVVYTDPIEANPIDEMESLRQLIHDMDTGLVDLLVIIGGNPVYTAPADLKFSERLSKVGLRVHLSLYHDETSELCHWHIPEAHYLESWSDTRAYDGTVTIIQPLIAPLYHGKTAHELITALTDQPERTSYDIVRDYWKSHQRSGVRGQGSGAKEGIGRSPTPDPRSLEFERFWRKALHDGFVPNTALAPKSVSLKLNGGLPAASQRPAPSPSSGMEVAFRTDPTIFDGRFANNGWLQELPKPLTKLTWDNAALISPATAERLGFSQKLDSRGGEHGGIHVDLVELRYQGRTVRAPIWITPGQPDDCITVHLGYGRKRAGRVGTGAGFNAYAIRTSDAPWFGSGLEVRKTGERYVMANTQLHHNMEGRGLVRSASLQEYRQHPHFAHEGEPEPPKGLTLYPNYEYKGYAWGMAIDIGACVGCSACVVACQAENNIPIVGKDEVIRGREMHWLRVDRYYKGDTNNPEGYFQPVPCMHCETAPCELVCPVAATVHSSEGLNDMVYNRCVGTRYCSNNCPYKVRRFNFLLFQDWTTPTFQLMRNPNVTVRSRGVMEKCTYCVQRINYARIEAEKEHRPIRDGEIVTACQATCPVDAIVFGDINDPNSRVAKLKAEPRNYGLLADLNTRPRTTYLAALRNPNPEIERA